MISVVLVGDHTLIRTGFRMILEQQTDIHISGEAGTGEEGLGLIREHNPLVALVDAHMPGMNGIELTIQVSRAQLPTRIAVVTMVEDLHFPKYLLDAGALGYLTCSCTAQELLQAVREVADGHRYLAPTVAQQLALATIDGHRNSPFDALSMREMEVAMQLARGKTLNAIGTELALSPKTISTYKQRLMEKLQLNHVISLARLMTVYGLIDPHTWQFDS